jgi:hypothetical protein
MSNVEGKHVALFFVIRILSFVLYLVPTLRVGTRKRLVLLAFTSLFVLRYSCFLRHWWVIRHFVFVPTGAARSDLSGNLGELSRRYASCRGTGGGLIDSAISLVSTPKMAIRCAAR